MLQHNTITKERAPKGDTYNFERFRLEDKVVPVSKEMLLEDLSKYGRVAAREAYSKLMQSAPNKSNQLASLVGKDKSFHMPEPKAIEKYIDDFISNSVKKSTCIAAALPFIQQLHHFSKLYSYIENGEVNKAKNLISNTEAASDLSSAPLGIKILYRQSDVVRPIDHISSQVNRLCTEDVS